MIKEDGSVWFQRELCVRERDGQLERLSRVISYDLKNERFSQLTFQMGDQNMQTGTQGGIFQSHRHGNRFICYFTKQKINVKFEPAASAEKQYIYIYCHHCQWAWWLLIAEVCEGSRVLYSHIQILDEVERRRGVSAALVYPFMRSLMESPFPAPGKIIKVKTFLPGEGNEVRAAAKAEHICFP